MYHFRAWRVLVLGAAAATLTGHSAMAADPLHLEPFLRVAFSNQQERLIPKSNWQRSAQESRGTAFVAVVLSSWTAWPSGLVPVFATESENHFELRRLPPRGMEGGVEPLFFALPREDEPHATNIVGTWNGAATNAQNSKYFPDWDLAIDGERIAGRFSPQGEYRVAYITGGTFRSNRLELHAEYFQDHYTLAGEFRARQLAGTWRQHDQSDRGTWGAVRPEQPPLPSTSVTVALYEWRRGGQRHYAPERPEGDGWRRAEKPLCRVWPAAYPIGAGKR